MSYDQDQRSEEERINPKIHTLPKDRKHARLFHAMSSWWKRQVLVGSKGLPIDQCRPKQISESALLSLGQKSKKETSLESREILSLLEQGVKA